MSGKRTNWYRDPDPNNSPALVRVAIESRLGQFEPEEKYKGRNGRDHYRIMHHIAESTAVERLANADEMGLRAEECELVGIMPAGSVSR